MDIEDLSKSQLLMLMLLVNFITSIATGVLTVSLLDQAPANVTQTVNRIVDHTIETIATSTPLGSIVAPQTVTKTIIQSSDTFLPDAIAAMSAREVTIYAGTSTSTDPIAVGTYLPKARAVVTDTQSSLPGAVTIVFSNGASQKASLSHSGATITIYGFGDSATLPTALAPTIVPSTSLKVGQTVVAFTSDGSAVTGIISKIDSTSVHTNLPVIPSGNSAVDLSGNIVGISTGVIGSFYPAEKITTLLNATTVLNAP
jgi:hypothetical protein